MVITVGEDTSLENSEDQENGESTLRHIELGVSDKQSSLSNRKERVSFLKHFDYVLGIVINCLPAESQLILP